MRAKLTKSFVDDLTPDPDPKKRRTVWDEDLPAFGVTVTPPGVRGGSVKSYIVQYRLGGRGAPTRRVTIGRHGREWQPREAREEAREMLRLVKRGEDPFEARRRRVEEESARRAARAKEEEAGERLRFPAISAEFVKDYAKLNQPSSWQNTERALKDLSADLGAQRLDAISRDDVRLALKRIKKRSSSAAIEAHKALRRMFGWAVAERIIPEAAHPMILMEPPAKGRKRQRVLTSRELVEVWAAAETLGYPFGSLIQFLILTGLRLRECSNAVWGEIHFAQGVWIIPKARMKREEDDERGDHLVPLPSLAVEFLRGLPRVVPPGEKPPPPGARPLFTVDGAAPVAGFSNLKVRADRQIAKARAAAAEADGRPFDAAADAMPHWTNHDLRRTMETALQALEVDSKIIDLLHDHRVPGVSQVSRHYQLWQFHPQKAEAMAVWDAYLRGALLGDEQHRALVERVDFKLLVAP
jgi:integrase